ncbi:MAG: diaminopimelate decarboxylase [Thermoplasmatales archaeon]|nr:diaminopimelate decarboxylase [Thermoplasmatales archaeon]
MPREYYPPILVNNHRMLIDGCDLEEIAKDFGTPLYVTSSNRIRENFERLTKSMSKNFKNFEIKYAVKANSNPHIISLFSELGSGADVSNLNELNLALKGGIAKEKIMLTSNNLQQYEMDDIAKQNIGINFDDIGQLERMKAKLPDIISFRFNPGTGHGYFPGITTGGIGTKFGILEDRILDAYSKAKDLGVKRFGFHYMEGSGILDPQVFGNTFSKAMEVMLRIQEKLGIEFEFIDAGGGLGIPYRPEEEPLDTAAVFSAFRSIVDKNKVDNENLKIIIEPGRYLIADTTVLMGQITNIKNSSRIFIGTDIGMSTLLRPALYGAYHEISLVNKFMGKHGSKCTVVGLVCETSDVIGLDRVLPDPKVGDLIIVFDTGAYGYSMSSQYNGNVRPAEVMIVNGKPKLIRRRETFQDLVSTVTP